MVSCGNDRGRMSGRAIRTGLVLLAGLGAGVLLAVGGCGLQDAGVGPDAVHLGMSVTQVREAMGGKGQNDPNDYASTNGADVMDFYWNYDDIRVHFNINQVVEIYRHDPQTGIWVRTQPPLAKQPGPGEESTEPKTTPPDRIVPGMGPQQP
ncbi:MAG: hypothetical protein ACREJ2_07515 [Planctomycetota bacterium]